jgi:hypothetical protein
MNQITATATYKPHVRLSLLVRAVDLAGSQRLRLRPRKGVAPELHNKAELALKATRLERPRHLTAAER